MVPSDIKLQFEKMQAIQDQIKTQQGLGRPIISFVNNGYRFVASGPKAPDNCAKRSVV
jgi:hypothetical protein